MPVDNSVIEKIEGLKEGKILVCGLHNKPSNVTWAEFFQFIKDVKVVDLSDRDLKKKKFELYFWLKHNVDDNQPSWGDFERLARDVTDKDAEDDNNTTIETEIRRVLEAMSELNVLNPPEVKIYTMLTKALERLYVIQKFT